MQDRFVVTLQDIATVKHAYCEIYSANGSLIASVKTLTGNLLIWDGKDLRGQEARAGVYLYTVKVDGREMGGKVFKVEQ
jgi:hypothetical protein